MKLVVDTDAFCKLQTANLLEDAVGLLGATLAGCGRLPALPHMLRRGRLRERLGEVTCTTILPIAEALPVVPAPSPEWLDELTAVDGVDVGEAQLFAAAAETGLLVMTGDKRALRALRVIDRFVPALERRIVVFEAILIALCDHLGPEAVRTHISPITTTDATVRVCFSDATTDPRAALLSYFEHLAAELHPLELWDPRQGVTQ